MDMKTFWSRYSSCIKNDEIILKKKANAFFVLYDVYLKKDNNFLGTCQILEIEEENPFECDRKEKCTCPICKYRVSVKEWGRTSRELRTYLGKVQHLVRESL